MSTLKVDKIDPQTGTALEIGSSGDTMTVPSGATLDISSATLTPPATMPASSAANLTALNATQITSGTIPDDARLPTVGVDKGGTGLTTGAIVLQHQYVAVDPPSSGSTVISSSQTDTMTGAPFTLTTPAFDTGSTSGTVWIGTLTTATNSEQSGGPWCLSARIWHSYNGGSSWTDTMGGDWGEYMWYTDHTDNYRTTATMFKFTLTASQSNTKVGAALYSSEGDNTRYNMHNGAGMYLSINQYR